MLASCSIAVFCALVFRQIPLLLTYIEGWSVYTAGIAGLLLVFFTVPALACTRRALTMVHYIIYRFIHSLALTVPLIILYHVVYVLSRALQ